jgi:hypothetical protein
MTRSTYKLIIEILGYYFMLINLVYSSQDLNNIQLLTSNIIKI